MGEVPCFDFWLYCKRRWLNISGDPQRSGGLLLLYFLLIINQLFYFE